MAEKAGSGKLGCALFALLGFLGLSFCVATLPRGAEDKGATAEQDDPFADESKQALWIVKSHGAIKSRLRDPGSADFRNSRFYSGGPVPVVCGEVNSKNGFGGYSGFQRFIASGDDPNIAFLASDMAAGDSINNVWDKLCIKAERDEAFVP